MAVPDLLNPNILSHIKRLSVSEKISLIEDIWDSIVLSEEALSVTEKQKKELDTRQIEYNKNPDDGNSWPEVKKKIESGL